MQRRPSLAVNLVHGGAVLQQEGHDLYAAIYAGLHTFYQSKLINIPIMKE